MEVVRLLHSLGCDLEVANKEGVTPVWAAANGGCAFSYTSQICTTNALALAIALALIQAP